MKTHGLSATATAVFAATMIFVAGIGIDGPLAASQCGKAAWYDMPGKAASGEYTSARAMVAAHRTANNNQPDHPVRSPLSAKKIGQCHRYTP